MKFLTNIKGCTLQNHLIRGDLKTNSLNQKIQEATQNWKDYIERNWVKKDYPSTYTSNAERSTSQKKYWAIKDDMVGYFRSKKSKSYNKDAEVGYTRRH